METQHEVITLQFGNYSNFVGAQLWNLQDEAIGVDKESKQKNNSGIDHEVLMRYHKVYHLVFLFLIHLTDPRFSLCALLRALSLSRCSTLLLSRVISSRKKKESKSYTPRLLLFDLKGGLGSLSKTTGSHSSYPSSTQAIRGQRLHQQPQHASHEEESRPWEGKLETVMMNVEEKNAFLRDIHLSSTAASSSSSPASSSSSSASNYSMEKVVQVWSDFVQTDLSPLSIHELSSVKFEVDPFNLWTHGVQSFSHNIYEKEDMLDSFRRLSEECDVMQGVQCMIDVDSGFGGFAQQFLSEVRDELGTRQPVWTYGLASAHSSSSQLAEERNVLNTALSIHSLICDRSPLTNVLIPIHPSPYWSSSLPYVGIDPSLKYHTSAVVASAIDTASLPFRLRDRSTSLTDLMWTIRTEPSMKLSSMSVALPFPLAQHIPSTPKADQLFGPRDILSASYLCNLSFADTIRHVVSEAVVLRGTRNVQHTKQLLDEFLSRHSCMNRTSETVSSKMALPIAFPRFFDTMRVTEEGEILHSSPEEKEKEESKATKLPFQVPVMSHVQTTTDMSHYIETLIARFEAIDKSKHVAYAEGGISADEWREARDQLHTLGDSYSTS
ncbi:mtDNA inheritance, partitioning of the mitochondrial organelle [Balamuthia mandrillaris]